MPDDLALRKSMDHLNLPEHMKTKQERFNNLMVLFEAQKIEESILSSCCSPGPYPVMHIPAFYRIPNQLLVAKRNFPASLEC